MRFAAHSRYLLSGGRDNCLKLVELSKAKQEHLNKNEQGSVRSRHTFYGHYNQITDAAVHPTHELLCSCALDADVRFYNLRANEADALVHSLGLGRGCTSVDFLAQGQVGVCTDDRCVHVYDVTALRAFTRII